MSILVAVTDSVEGRFALTAAADEARHFATDLVVLNLTPDRLMPDTLPRDVALLVVEGAGQADDHADTVLDYVREHPSVDRLVIGVKRRSPVGKAVFGSTSQRLLLDSPVPVLAVRPPVPA